MADKIAIDDSGDFEITASVYTGNGYDEYTLYIDFEEIERFYLQAVEIRSILLDGHEKLKHKKK